tara:strand:- start:7422 stop:8174 length:753 start_codon:yes stop_codon:yes gene_type:complete
MYCCDLAGEPLALRPGMDLEHGGVGLVFNWTGEEERLEGWGSGPSPDILFHEYNEQEQEQEQEQASSPVYRRSLVTPGTRINLRLMSCVFDARALHHHLQARTVPKSLQPPRWRSPQKRVQILAASLSSFISDIGLPIQLEGPTLGLRRMHSLYAIACNEKPDLIQALMKKGTPPDIKPQKLRDRTAIPEVFDIAGYLLRSLNIHTTLGPGEAFSLIPGSALSKDAHALSSQAPKAAVKQEKTFRKTHVA